jgi:hypothetical protein
LSRGIYPLAKWQRGLLWLKKKFYRMDWLMLSSVKYRTLTRKRSGFSGWRRTSIQWRDLSRRRWKLGIFRCRKAGILVWKRVSDSKETNARSWGEYQNSQLE